MGHAKLSGGARMEKNDRKIKNLNDEDTPFLWEKQAFTLLQQDNNMGQ